MKQYINIVPMLCSVVLTLCNIASTLFPNQAWTLYQCCATLEIRRWILFHFQHRINVISTLIWHWNLTGLIQSIFENAFYFIFIYKAISNDARFKWLKILNEKWNQLSRSVWLKQGSICNNLANIVVKSKEEIKKRDLKL